MPNVLGYRQGLTVSRGLGGHQPIQSPSNVTVPVEPTTGDRAIAAGLAAVGDAIAMIDEKAKGSKMSAILSDAEKDLSIYRETELVNTKNPDDIQGAYDNKKGIVAETYTKRATDAGLDMNQFSSELRRLTNGHDFKVKKLIFTKKKEEHDVNTRVRIEELGDSASNAPFNDKGDAIFKAKLKAMGDLIETEVGTLWTKAAGDSMYQQFRDKAYAKRLAAMIAENPYTAKQQFDAGAFDDMNATEKKIYKGKIDDAIEAEDDRKYQLKRRQEVEADRLKRDRKDALTLQLVDMVLSGNEADALGFINQNSEELGGSFSFSASRALTKERKDMNDDIAEAQMTGLILESVGADEVTYDKISDRLIDSIGNPKSPLRPQTVSSLLKLLHATRKEGPHTTAEWKNEYALLSEVLEYRSKWAAPSAEDEARIREGKQLYWDLTHGVVDDGKNWSPRDAANYVSKKYIKEDVGTRVARLERDLGMSPGTSSNGPAMMRMLSSIRAIKETDVLEYNRLHMKFRQLHALTREYHSKPSSAMENDLNITTPEEWRKENKR